MKLLRILSKIMLILNPISGCLMIGCFIESKYYFIPLLIIGVILNFKFYFYTHRHELEKYEAWEKEFRKTHTYLGENYYGSVWRNDKTYEIIEV